MKNDELRMKWKNGRIEEPKNRRMKWGMKNDELRMKWRNGRIEEPEKGRMKCRIENAEWKDILWELITYEFYVLNR